MIFSIAGCLELIGMALIIPGCIMPWPIPGIMPRSAMPGCWSAALGPVADGGDA